MKAQTIYNITMSLIDERKDDGSVDISSTKDYLARSPGILTVIQTEITMELKKVGADVETLDEVEDMDTDIELKDDICFAIIPYALAAQLLLQEDATLSNYFASKYDEKLYRYLSEYREKAKQVEREDVYNSNMRAGD